MKPVAALFAATLTLPAACAPAERPAPAPLFAAVDAGYLAPGVLQRLAEAVPPPPAENGPDDLADQAESARFVGLEDTDRWLLAVAHAELRPPLALQHFDCALGVRLGSARTPVLDRMAAKAFHDAQAAAVVAAAPWDRPRPIRRDPERRACQTVTPELRRSPAYPSAPAAVGAAYGEILALVDPERADAVRRIGREIGVSRLVCAMNGPADVEAGAGIGRAAAAAIAAEPDFQADLPAARAELAAARATGRTNPGCAAERAALADQPASP